MIVTGRFNRLKLSWVRCLGLSLSVAASLFCLLGGGDLALGQRIVDTGPRFAADTASAWAGTSGSMRSGGGGNAWGGGGWVGGGWNGGGWNGWSVPYTVRLAGQNPTFPLSVYGSPRQYGAHDHGFQHARHPDQARFNQFGRNHWVATPILPCWQPCPPVCLQPWSPWCGVPPICNPWLAPPGWGWSNPWGWNNGWNGGGWAGGGWGWQGWRRQAWGWNGGGFVGGFGGGFAGGMVEENVQMFARPGTGVMAPLELTVAPTDVANALIESRAADVLAQQRAVAAAEQAAAQQRGARTQEQATMERDPLGRPRAALPVVQAIGEGSVVVSSRVDTPAKSVANTPPRSARQIAESLEQRRAAQAEAERQRLLERLRRAGGQ